MMFSLSSFPDARDQIIDDDILPGILLVNLHQVDPKCIGLLFLKHQRKQLGTTTNRIHPVYQVTLSVVLFTSSHCHFQVTASRKNLSGGWENFTESHPDDFVFGFVHMAFSVDRSRVDGGLNWRK